MQIAVISPLFSRSPKLMEQMRERFGNVKHNADNALKTKADLIAFLDGIEVAIVGREEIDAEVLRACPTLKMLSRYGVGLDNLDLEAMQQYGVKLGWTGGTNRNSVAEITLYFMLALIHNTYIASTLLKKHTWKVNGGMELSGKTIGLFGFGNIAKRVIELLKPFSCTILVYNRTHDEDEAKRYGITFASKAQILREADIVSIHLPLTDESRNLFSTAEFEAMKPTSYIINTARGGIIDEEALKVALKTGQIAGAGLEAFLEEPTSDWELIDLPNLMCLPHVGGNSKESILAMGEACIAHIEDYVNLL
ncbi:phosphoglycerate dehydrogenase [Sulfurospirillum sp. hDNRA2]|uniref:phosphoglycerate dehydrogenase n=1 Tax=Sulfurospirillum sp. hDNRA2 TaxID=3237298 RepID=UPI0020B70C86|nr:phosphoglycerate dehydrogenase [Sulfurospirillum sp. DNRA8]MCP3652931.1 phosphoglycerate dehydrogenase [Sulfurospirillum sp. DNRA8]MCR1811783.1 phosphoglycerate dehydrogenase [Sulfurospirillum sp. DNRA8]